VIAGTSFLSTDQRSGRLIGPLRSSFVYDVAFDVRADFGELRTRTNAAGGAQPEPQLNGRAGCGRRELRKRTNVRELRSNLGKKKTEEKVRSFGVQFSHEPR